MASVEQRHPEFSFRIEASQYTAITLLQLLDGTLDLGLVAGPLDIKGLSSLSLGPQRIGVIMRTDHRLAAMPEVPVRELEFERFIQPPPGPGINIRNSVLELCAEAGFRPRQVAEITDTASFQMLVRAGVGVCGAGESHAVQLPADLVFRPLIDPAKSVDTLLVWRPDRLTQALRNVLRAARTLTREA